MDCAELGIGESEAAEYTAQRHVLARGTSEKQRTYDMIDQCLNCSYTILFLFDSKNGPMNHFGER